MKTWHLSRSYAGATARLRRIFTVSLGTVACGLFLATVSSCEKKSPLDPCLEVWKTDAVSPPGIDEWDLLGSAVDQEGTPHLVGVTDAADSLFYITKKLGEWWYRPIPVDPLGCGDIEILSASIAVDSDGVRHISYSVDCSEPERKTRIGHACGLPGGRWTQEGDVHSWDCVSAGCGGGLLVPIRAVNQTVHIGFSQDDGDVEQLGLATRDGGVWKEPTDLYRPNYPPLFVWSLDVGSDGTVHMLYESSGSQGLIYARRAGAGNWNTQRIFPGPVGWFPSIGVYGTSVHTVFAASGELLHASSPAFAPDSILPSGSDIEAFAPGMAIAPDGRIVVAFYDGTSSSVMMTIYDGGNWTPAEPIHDGVTVFFLQVAIDARGCIHAFYQDLKTQKVVYAHR